MRQPGVDDAVAVLRHEREVEHAQRPGRLEALELIRDVALEVGVLEVDHEDLERAWCHARESLAPRGEATSLGQSDPPLRQRVERVEDGRPLPR